MSLLTLQDANFFFSQKKALVLCFYDASRNDNVIISVAFIKTIPVITTCNGNRMIVLNSLKLKRIGNGVL